MPVINEKIIRSKINDLKWIIDNKTNILKSIKDYPQDLIDILSENIDLRDYIIKNSLYSDIQAIRLIDNSLKMNTNTFDSLCASLKSEDFVLYLYNKILDIEKTRTFGSYFTVLWMRQHDILIKDKQRVLFLFKVLQNRNGRDEILMDTIIKKHPELLLSLLKFNPIDTIRFYSSIGKLVYFSDECMDILINTYNSIQDNELNLFRFKELTRNIFLRENCSKLKHAEILLMMK